MFCEVSPSDWTDYPVAVIGAGASLRGVDLTRIFRHAYIIAVKAMIFDLPFADVGFGLDLIDLNRWIAPLRVVQMPVYWGMPGEEEGKTWPKELPACIKPLRRDTAAKLSTDRVTVCGGGTSGFGALNLAVMKGGRSIYLFGFDYRPLHGRWHRSDRFYDPSHKHDLRRWQIWATNFDRIKEALAARDIAVYNCSPQSAITAFPRLALGEGIELLRRERERPQ